MAKKYTPGPWRKGKYGPNGCYTVGTEKGLMVAMIAHSVNHYEQREQAEANALLISCAPELLEALEAIYNHPNTRYEVEVQIGGEVWDIIRKAKGE